MSAVITRILLRYFAGALVAKGLVSPSLGDFLFSDPDVAALVEIGSGLALGAAVEGFYLIAKRLGWST